MIKNDGFTTVSKTDGSKKKYKRRFSKRKRKNAKYRIFNGEEK